MSKTTTVSFCDKPEVRVGEVTAKVESLLAHSRTHNSNAWQLESSGVSEATCDDEKADSLARIRARTSCRKESD